MREIKINILLSSRTETVRSTHRARNIDDDHNFYIVLRVLGYIIIKGTVCSIFYYYILVRIKKHEANFILQNVKYQRVQEWIQRVSQK